jgi:hypothetical protein
VWSANALADVEHRSLIALAFADDDVARDLHFFKGSAHRLNGGLIGSFAIALAHGSGGGNGGFFDDMDEIARKIAFDSMI